MTATTRDQPGAAELIEAVRTFLEEDVLPQHAGPLGFQLRVALTALGIAGREMTLGESNRDAHRGRLRELGYDDDAALAVAVRDGAVDDRYATVAQLVRLDTWERLMIANPSYAGQHDDPLAARE
jgi:hypothetical protein